MYRFIQNTGDFFTTGYFSEDFKQKVQAKSGYSSEDLKEIAKRFSGLKEKYFRYKQLIISGGIRRQDKIKETHDFHTHLLQALGYDILKPSYETPFILSETEVVPVRYVLSRDGQPQLLIMEMQPLIKEGDLEPDGLFEQQYDTEESTGEQRYRACQWKKVFNFDNEFHISPSIINEAISELFLLKKEQRPRYILMLAGNRIFLFDADKWFRGAYLQFDLEELFAEASLSAFRDYYALFYLLTSKMALANDSQIVLMEQLEEDSYKNAYEVTKDLKDGVIHAVEALANEAIYYRKEMRNEQFDETDDTFELEMKDDCLVLIYRLLFIFYAEARTDLDILPLDDKVYAHGYSLEMLRDMEQTNMHSEQSRNGYFFHDSLFCLFALLSSGNRENADIGEKSFRVRRIDSPLFDDSRLKQLREVKFRNTVWQDIIRSLSLSKQQRNKSRGRISYASLGINQLGSVYESLLAYRGFYAEEDYIEVHKADSPKDGTFLVPRSRMDDFKENEILHDEEGNKIVLPKGSFVYRLNGRDRQKSASYYTPEVLTRCTVKYTLKPLLEKVAKGEMKARELLNLKILEPAMGAAAFQNEVIDQLAEAYLIYSQEERQKRIAPNFFREELQKVKAYIATNNVYGVDLNPTAIELGKLSLWLNVIHKDMETPFFSNRLAVGNAVIGAWLQVYNQKDVMARPVSRGKKMEAQSWWEKAPEPVKFFSSKVNRKKTQVYHFLLPDKNMLATMGIRELKSAYPKEAKRMTDLKKEWTKELLENDFARLVRISEKIDVLLKEYVTFQISINANTSNNTEVWGMLHKDDQAVIPLQNYAEKERLNDTRYRRNNAYFKLKTIMDYWCALWFWDIREAEQLPTRDQYWNDIENMLNIDMEAQAKMYEVKTKLRSSVVSSRMEDMFAPKEYLMDFNDAEPEVTPYQEAEQEAALVQESAETILGRYKDESVLFNESERINIVQKLAKRYRFFHPQLEFLEVFWFRGGFDVICGNPPWLKLEFDEQGIMAEKYPEVAIRKIPAPKVKTMKEELFKNQFLKELYESELIENACSAAFLNAYCNYPLLVGQQTNLYKCVLENGFTQLSDNGFMGLLHPETIYDDPNGQPLREEVYPRLRYHFQFINELSLFAEVHHNTIYGVQIYSGRKSEVDFLSIHNLYHPSTIDACFAHSGMGIVEGIKAKNDVDGKYIWNTKGHKDRIVHFSTEGLKVLAKTFEDSDEWQTTKLVSIHTKEIIEVLESLSIFTQFVRSYRPIITVAIDETHGVDDSIMKRNTCFPDYLQSQMMYSGPHFFVGNPSYKTPRSSCLLNSDYDTIDLLSIHEDFTARTNYTPVLSLPEYKKIIKGFVISQDSYGEPVYDDWIDHYKVGFRKMLSQAGERTLTSAILPPNTSHTNGVISVTFQNQEMIIELAGLTSSVVLDFFMKTMGASNLYDNRLSSFPLGIEDKYKSALYSRTLLLNCLNKYYADLWNNNFDENFTREEWSKNDLRLKPFSGLTNEWKWETPLRNYYERRMALVEIDVITAMALNLTLDELILIYNVQFPVLQQNEDDTWYDVNGNVVFTCSKGLTGVGVDRSMWNEIRNLPAGKTYTHTITKSELYQGKEVVYVAPFTKCDRVEDYKRAWGVFEKRWK